MENTIELKNVSYKRNQRVILANINLEVEKGTTIGLLGENGAGKTTLMRSIAGVAKGARGVIKIKDETGIVERKALVSYTDSLDGFSKGSKITDIVDFYSQVYPDFSTNEYRELSDFLDFGSDQQKLGELSKGMKEKLVISLTLARRASVYLLDEPFEGIDSMTRKKIVNSLIQWEIPDAVMMISDHYISEISGLLDEVAIIKDDHLIAHEKTENIREQGVSIEDYYEGLYDEEVTTNDESQKNE